MGHNHKHNHNHEPPTSLKNLLFAMVINGGIVVFEMIFGVLIVVMTAYKIYTLLG